MPDRCGARRRGGTTCRGALLQFLTFDVSLYHEVSWYSVFWCVTTLTFDVCSSASDLTCCCRFWKLFYLLRVDRRGARRGGGAARGGASPTRIPNPCIDIDRHR